MIIEDVHLGPQPVTITGPDRVRVVVSDIDGTIADLSHRKPFIEKKPKDWKSFKKAISWDKPILPIIRVIKTMWCSDIKIILVSGREGDQWGREKTEQWLFEHRVPYDALYMRAEKDYRNDDIVKAELKDQVLRDHGAIDLVLDDRDRVVQMWRQSGIRTIQVADGDF